MHLSSADYSALTLSPDPKPGGPVRLAFADHGLAQRERLAYALSLSLFVHAVLLGLTVIGQGLGLPSFGFFWQERRFEEPELRVSLVPVPFPPTELVVAPPESSLPLQVDRSGSGSPAPATAASPSPSPKEFVAAIVPESEPEAEAHAEERVRTLGGHLERSPQRLRSEETEPVHLRHGRRVEFRE